jgi:hypothetical protein
MGTIREDSAAETAEKLVEGMDHRPPFSMVGDWVLLAPIRHQAKVLYWALVAHVNHDREDDEVWPSQDTLAAILGLSDGRKIRPFIKELEAIGAITVRKVRSKGAMRQRSIYKVRGTPPDGLETPKDLAQFYRERKKAIELAQTEQLELPMPSEEQAKPATPKPAATPKAA